uniref:Uncharacterized protein n=1 Tax=Arundo donax TaxID=35708 RepID=A0A0A9F209_ARUDO
MSKELSRQAAILTIEKAVVPSTRIVIFIHTKLDMGVCKERLEGLEYRQRTIHGYECMEISNPRAITMT